MKVVAILPAVLLLSAHLNSLAADFPKGEEILSESFDGESLGKGWNAQFGEWKPSDGVLRARELEADEHAAAARRVIALQDAVFEIRFRLVKNGKAFHFGFDPARGELDKRGHLFSIIVTPNQAKLMKHLDKQRPKEDPNETLSTVNGKFGEGAWHTLTLLKKGNQVTAQIKSENGDQSVRLEASHPTFHVKTPTLVFRCAGDGIEVDDVKVWAAGE